jgi:hypothetical protein
MPRSGSHGAWHDSDRRFRGDPDVRAYVRAQRVRVVCQKCGRPLGYLVSPNESPLDFGAIEWFGAEVVSDAKRRAQCVRACGAKPVYLLSMLRAKYEAARAAGQQTVRL